MTRVFVGIGSNIDPENNFSQAFTLLEKHFSPINISPIYQCQAVGFEGDLFLNAVIEFHSDQPLERVASQLHAIERQFDRYKQSPKYRSRKLDLDLLLFGDLILHDEQYEIPRSDITKFAFVLKPLADLAPQLTHPQLKITMDELWHRSQLLEFPMTPVLPINPN